jgi:cytoskeletal protein RodZ
MVSNPRPADFGARLREARERRGLSLREIADATKISARSLEALERNDIVRLPGGIFSRAFVRAYALHVGLDPEETISEFMASFPDDSVTQGHPRTRDKSILDELEEDSRRGRWPAVGWLALIGVVVVALLTYALFSFYRGKSRQTGPVSAVTRTARPAVSSSGAVNDRDDANSQYTTHDLMIMASQAGASGKWWAPRVRATRISTSAAPVPSAVDRTPAQPAR